MDNNEIPPYDIPFDDNNGQGENINIQNGNNEDFFNAPLTDDFIGQSDFQEEQNLLNTPIQQEMPAGSEDFAEMSEMPPSEQKNPKSKSGGSIAILLGVVILLSVILLAALGLIYYSDRIPFLAKNQTDNISTMDLSYREVNDLDELPMNENSQYDSEMENLENENSEDTGISITRNSRGNKGISPEGRENGQFPPLPNANNKNDINGQDETLMVSRYYSGGGSGRLDPFNPKGSNGDDMFEIIVPPVDPTPDIQTQMLMSLRISGIMYTPDSPSAIINIAGEDQLVRKGDQFDGFKIMSITKDKVTVKYGVNVYTASVGEIISVDQVGVNAIPNLNKKFAGPYSKGKDRIIEIHMLD